MIFIFVGVLQPWDTAQVDLYAINETITPMLMKLGCISAAPTHLRSEPRDGRPGHSSAATVTGAEPNSSQSHVQLAPQVKVGNASFDVLMGEVSLMTKSAVE